MQYIPSTEEIRLVTTGLSARYAFSFEEFDAWLASVKAEAWYEGVRAAFHESIEFDGWVPYELKNPYRTED